jgi:DnaA N-terminal domain
MTATGTSFTIVRRAPGAGGARAPPAGSRPPPERRKTGCPPGLPKHRRRRRHTNLLPGNVPGFRTDSNVAMEICAQKPRLRLIANTRASSVGDGAQPQSEHRQPAALRAWALRKEHAMSHRAIAAALALQDASSGERLVAFSLASFANREERCWPGARIAAARAGLSRSQYLHARERLARRGLITVDTQAGGRGNSALMKLTFAEHGTRLEGEINAELFELVLSCSRTRGSARLLIAALAGVSDSTGMVDGVTTDTLREIAGLSDRTYRRAREQLLNSGDAQVEAVGGGRAKTNRWRIRDPRLIEQRPLLAPRPRPVPSRSVRPLLASAQPGPRGGHPQPATDDQFSTLGPTSSGLGQNPGQFRTVPRANPGQARTLSNRNPGQSRTVSTETPVNPGLFQPQTPAETPAKTPAPNARTGREPQNLRTTPPDPPEGGQTPAAIAIEEHYVTSRGRNRSRTVRIDLDEVHRRLGSPTDVDNEDWQRIRALLSSAVNETVFMVWFEPLDLVATDNAGALVVAGERDTSSWLRSRFGPLLTACAERAGRQLRIADEPEQRALTQAPLAEPDFEINQQEVL